MQDRRRKCRAMAAREPAINEVLASQLDRLA